MGVSSGSLTHGSCYRTVLAEIVRYHMLPMAVNTANMGAGDVLKTSLAGHKITVTAVTPRVRIRRSCQSHHTPRRAVPIA